MLFAHILEVLDRKLSELVLNVVKEKGSSQQGGISSDGKVKHCLALLQT